MLQSPHQLCSALGVGMCQAGEHWQGGTPQGQNATVVSNGTDNLFSKRSPPPPRTHFVLHPPPPRPPRDRVRR